MIPFNYHHLYYFYIIATEGSISRAALKLRLAQPTLSAQLKQFERFLDVNLFIRENRNLMLTEEGHQVLAYAKMIFDIGLELKDRMVDLNHKKGRIRFQIGVTNSIPKTITETLLTYLLNADPTVYLVLVKDNMKKLIQDLGDHVIDVILSDAPFTPHKSHQIKNYSIGRVPIVFCAHPRLAKTIKRIPKDLDKAPLILPASSRPLFNRLQEYFIEHNIEPNIIGEIEDVEIVRRLALRGYGVAALNLLTALKAPSQNKLVVLKTPPEKMLYEHFYLPTKIRKRAHPLVEKLLKDFHVNSFIS